MEDSYYVALTGAKNNAGDFLIKYRAKELISAIRPDRKVVDIDGWKPLGTRELELINNSKALILMGGPALQRKMRPKVYALGDDLDAITAPIVTMGIGWFNSSGSWEDTHRFRVNKLSKLLLQKINSGQLVCSVRDYHTQNALQSMGYQNYVMTGCPALYSLPHLEQTIPPLQHPRKIGFSLGVSIKWSRRMTSQMQKAVLATRDKFPDAAVEIAFHHGCDQTYLETHGASKELYAAQLSFAEWLQREGFASRDISGSAEKLIEFYRDCDLHIGYRVHAHIFMSSISKPSILLIEDGRGDALMTVVGGVGLRAYRNNRYGQAKKIARGLGFKLDAMQPAVGVLNDFCNIIDYERATGVRIQQPRDSIDKHFPVMKQFLMRLP